MDTKLKLSSVMIPTVDIALSAKLRCCGQRGRVTMDSKGAGEPVVKLLRAT